MGGSICFWVLQCNADISDHRHDNDVSFLANKKWDVESLNEKIPYIQEEIEGTIYYAPIPKGFTVSTNANENKISEGLVIQDSEGNQFVWVPVNDSYKIVGDVNGDGTFHNWHELYYENYAITDIPSCTNGHI